MRGVRSLSGIAGTGASLALAGLAGSAGPAYIVGSWVYTDGLVGSPVVDISGIDFQKGDTLLMFCTSYYEENDAQYWKYLGADGFARIYNQVMTTGATSFAGRCYARTLTGGETTFSQFSTGFGSMVIAVVVRNAGNPMWAFASSAQDAPAIANADGDLVFGIGYARTTFDASFAPPAGYTLIGSGINAAASNSPLIYVYAKEGAVANEDPGAPTWVSNSAAGSATVAL